MVTTRTTSKIRTRTAIGSTDLHFLAALDGLREELVRMGEKAEKSVALAVQCYLTRDARLCVELLSIESELRQCERNVDEIAIRLQSRQQLPAADLRSLTAFMKINTNLKHIGDVSLQIGDISLSEYQPRVLFGDSIRGIGVASSEMIHRTLNALTEADGDTADAVFCMGDIVKRMSNDTWVHLVADMRESTEGVDSALTALMVTRSLERISGYAASMAKDILFWICGAEVEPVARGRHGSGIETWNR